MIYFLNTGGVYYKTVMRKRAAERAKVRRRREKIRLEVLEKELRHQLAKSIDYKKVLDSGWNLAATEDESSSEEDTTSAKETIAQKIITPRIFSQSNPVLSRPNSSHHEGNRAFMTEVEVVDRIKNDATSVMDKVEAIKQQRDRVAKTKNYTVCLVYDEASGSSLIKHYGPSSIQPADELTVYEEDEDESDSSADNEVFTSNAICDSKMVGADKHMAVLDKKDKKHQHLSGAVDKKKGDEDTYIRGMDKAHFLPSINVTLTNTENKEATDDENYSEPPESSRHSFSAPQNARLRAKTATSVLSRRKSDSILPLPRVTSSEAPVRPSATFIAQFVSDEGGSERRQGKTIETGEHYKEMLKQAPSMINPVS